MTNKTRTEREISYVCQTLIMYILDNIDLFTNLSNNHSCNSSFFFLLLLVYIPIAIKEKRKKKKIR